MVSSLRVRFYANARGRQNSYLGENGYVCSGVLINDHFGFDGRVGEDIDETQNQLNFNPETKPLSNRVYSLGQYT